MFINSCIVSVSFVCAEMKGTSCQRSTILFCLPINILKISLVGSKSENGQSKFIVSVSANRLVGCSLQICCSGVIFVCESNLMLPNLWKGATRLSVGRSEFDL